MRLRRPSGVARAAEAGEDLAADREVPVAEGVARRPSGASPRSRRAAPCSRGRRTPRSTRGRGRPRSPGSAAKSDAVHSQTSPIIWWHAEGARARRVGADRGRLEVALAEVRDAPATARRPTGSGACAPRGIPRRGLLPLGLGRQPLARPAGVGVGLVPADVLHRLVERAAARGGRSAARPRAAALAPPEPRMLETAPSGAAPSPSALPEALVVVAAGLDELAGRRALVTGAASIQNGGKLDLVRRPLVVVGPRLGVGAHDERARRRRAPRPRRRARPAGGGGARAGRAPSRSWSVCEHRLVVLVLVLDDHRRRRSRPASSGSCRVEVDLLEELERAPAHVGDVSAAPRPASAAAAPDARARAWRNAS